MTISTAPVAAATVTAPVVAPPGFGLWRLMAARAFRPVDVASLACFRVAFGAVMAWEVVRFFQNGWIAAYYIDPPFHFTYFGFGWVKPWPGVGMYVHFALLGLAALGILLGLWYRLCAGVFFVGFAYVFLLDEALYLNHFYLIVLLSLLLAFLSMDVALSIDARRLPTRRSDTVPAWTLFLLRAQVGIPYLYGGLAKLNPDWLRGEPMRSWLAERTDVPVLGPYFTREWTVFTFAYGGLLLDLLIVPLLAWRRTRPFAFGLGVVFHGLNAVLFDIGIFPWLMMAATTIFFAPDWPRRLRLLPARRPAAVEAPRRPRISAGLTVVAAAAYLCIQALVPLRHFAYPGNVSWTEEGHRFSWHMKLRDKEAQARFLVTDVGRGESRMITSSRVLTPRQEGRMAGQPDMILQFAHHLAERLPAEGRAPVQVRAWVSASLNGREPQLLIDPATDLAAQPRTLGHAPWILPLRQSVTTGRRGVGHADIEE
jgi:hypothetical protein